MALDPVASFVVLALWRTSMVDPKVRELMARKLLEQEDQIRENSWTLWKKMGLNQFKTNTEQWQQAQQKQSKARKMFDTFFEHDNPVHIPAEERTEAESKLMEAMAPKEKKQ